MKLKPYNSYATCPKCGHTEVGTIHYDGSGIDGLARSEHLHRCCQRCGYSWPERCLPRHAASERGDLVIEERCAVHGREHCLPKAPEKPNTGWQVCRDSRLDSRDTCGTCRHSIPHHDCVGRGVPGLWCIRCAPCETPPAPIPATPPPVEQPPAHVVGANVYHGAGDTGQFVFKVAPDPRTSDACIDTRHCWHSPAVVVESWPARGSVICCYCGRIRREGIGVSAPPPTPHGPFQPPVPV